MALKTRAPTSDIAATGTWSGTSGARYAELDDYPDTSTALELSTIGTLVLGFSAMDVPAGSTVNSVSVKWYADKNGVLANEFAGRLRLGAANNYNGTVRNLVNGTPTAYADTWTINPFTTAAWTVAEVNGTSGDPDANIEGFGFASSDSNPTIRAYSVQLEVNYTPPAAPTLSGAQVTGITPTGATPRVTITF